MIGKANRILDDMMSKTCFNYFMYCGVYQINELWGRNGLSKNQSLSFKSKTDFTSQEAATYFKEENIGHECA